MSELESILTALTRIEETLGTMQEALGLLLEVRSPAPQHATPMPAVPAVPVASYAQIYGQAVAASQACEGAGVEATLLAHLDQRPVTEEAPRYTTPEPPRRLALWSKQRRA